MVRVGVDAAKAALPVQPGRRAARPVPAHPVLPEALPLLLLSASTPTRMPARSRATSTCWRASGTCTWTRPPSPGGLCTSCTSAGARRRFSRRSQLETARAARDGGRRWSRRGVEITFECEPGTLSEPKLAAIRGFGVTRFSLGVENFDDRILELNGRAHRSPEIERVPSGAARSRFPRSTSTSSRAWWARPTPTGARASRRRSSSRPTA
jgi:hypothetical protein